MSNIKTYGTKLSTNNDVDLLLVKNYLSSINDLKNKFSIETFDNIHKEQKRKYLKSEQYRKFQSKELIYSQDIDSVYNDVQANFKSKFSNKQWWLQCYKIEDGTKFIKNDKTSIKMLVQEKTKKNKLTKEIIKIKERSFAPFYTNPSLQLHSCRFKIVGTKLLIKIPVERKKKNIKCDWVSLDMKMYYPLKYYLKKYKYGEPTLSLKENQLYINIPFKLEDPPINNNTDWLGIDIGINRLLTTSNGVIYDCKKIRDIYHKHIYIDDILKSKRDTGSKSAKKNLINRKGKISSQRKTILEQFAHFVAKDLLSNNIKGVILEDLNTSKMLTKGLQNKRKLSMFSLKSVHGSICSVFTKYGIETKFVCPKNTSRTTVNGEILSEEEYKIARPNFGGRFIDNNSYFHADALAAKNILESSDIDPSNYSQTIIEEGLIQRKNFNLS